MSVLFRYGHWRSYLSRVAFSEAFARCINLAEVRFSLLDICETPTRLTRDRRQVMVGVFYYHP